MATESGWARPNEFTMLFRCTSSKFADDFIKNGSIKFNTPASWVKYSIEKGEGRGDRLEGTIALCHCHDIEEIKELNEKYESCHDLIRMPFDERIYLKNKRSMELPCYCLYVMKHSLFECPNKEGVHKLAANVPASYFRDFMDNISPEEVEIMSDEEKPALIIIKDFDEFKRRLLKYLLSIGLEENDILISYVTYFDFEKYGRMGWWDFERKSPNELYIKNKRFENQSESRIIINTNNNKAKGVLRKEPIEIGSLADIAMVHKGYLHEGIQIEMTVNIAKENRK